MVARRLSVLLVTQSYHPSRGGIGEHVRHLGLGLVARGHRVRVLTVGPTPEGGELPGLDVVRIGRRIEVPSNGSRASLGLHANYARAVRPLVRDSVDLIHLHSPLEPLLPWAVLAEARAPCVGTFHNAGRSARAYRLLARWMAPMARQLALRTAVSRCAASFVGGALSGEYLIVPNGVDLGRFSPGRTAPSPGPLRVLFVGRIEPRKGLEVLLRAAGLARRRTGAPLEVVVAGTGSLERSLRRRSPEWGTPVRWLGDVDPLDLPRVYRSADLLAAPAIHGESFGIVLLEALASGLPVVASSIPGFREVLDRCPAALLVPPGDALSLAEGLIEIGALCRGSRLREAARAHARSFAWDRVTRATEDAYEEALGGVPAPVPRVLFRAGREVGGLELPLRTPARGHSLLGGIEL